MLLDGRRAAQVRLAAQVEFIAGCVGGAPRINVLDFDKVHVLSQEATLRSRPAFAALDFAAFGSPEGVGFDAYALLQFPHEEAAFAAAYDAARRVLLAMDAEALAAWETRLGLPPLREWHARRA